MLSFVIRRTILLALSFALGLRLLVPVVELTGLLTTHELAMIAMQLGLLPKLTVGTFHFIFLFTHFQARRRVFVIQVDKLPMKEKITP